MTVFNETDLSGTQSNADKFHSELTQFNLEQRYNIVDLYNENNELRNKLKKIKKSKSFRV